MTDTEVIVEIEIYVQSDHGKLTFPVVHAETTKEDMAEGEGAFFTELLNPLVDSYEEMFPAAFVHYSIQVYEK